MFEGIVLLPAEECKPEEIIKTIEAHKKAAVLSLDKREIFAT